MPYNPEIHHRKSIRLKGYNYTRPGYYFITINLDTARCVLAEWRNETFALLPVGLMVQHFWEEIPMHYPHVKLDKYVIMPDHMHGILQIIDRPVGACHGVPLQRAEFQKLLPGSINSIVNQFKGAVTRWCWKNGYDRFKWQKNYHDRIIRNESELKRIRTYIRNNPERLKGVRACHGVPLFPELKRRGVVFCESDLRPISALQHIAYCERQCCLIHIEQSWSENMFTAEGRVLHERVHEQNSESRGGIYIVRGLRLCSLEIGLSGIADVVEFHKVENDGVVLRKKKGLWQPFPVEYKRGKRKNNRCDEVQLCAQALCLEEMLNTHIKYGALFYGSNHRRVDVCFDEELRAITRENAMKLHRLLNDNQTPPAEYSKKCNNCSLLEICMPKIKKQNTVAGYIEKAIKEPYDFEMY